MGNNEDSRHIEYNGLFGEQNANTHNPAYGIDRYAYNQGYNALYDFQVFENQEPCLISRGGAAVCCPRNLGNSTKRKSEVFVPPTTSGYNRSK